MRTIGITKELDPDEKLVFSTHATELISLKQSVFEKIRGWERIEQVDSMLRAIIYVTNKRLIFLKLFEVPGASSGQKKNLLVGSAGTFVEIPFDGISSVMQRKLRLSRDNTFRFVTVFGGDQNRVNDGQALEVAYNERTVHPKKEATNVADLLVVLGDPMFTLEPILLETIRNYLRSTRNLS